jgi:hypothetical protein
MFRDPSFFLISKISIKITKKQEKVALSIIDGIDSLLLIFAHIKMIHKHVGKGPKIDLKFLFLLEDDKIILLNKKQPQELPK